MQGEPFLAGEALRGTDPKPLIPGPNIAVIQLELSWTQNVWKTRVETELQREDHVCAHMTHDRTSPLHVACATHRPLADLIGDQSPSGPQSR